MRTQVNFHVSIRLQNFVNLFTLRQSFPNFNEHQNHQEALLKHTFWGPAPEFLLQ